MEDVEFQIGDQVVTVKPEQESTDWTAEAKASRRWNVWGRVIYCSAY